MPILIDAHEDLAWNMLTFGRDYTNSAKATRMIEANNSTTSHNGNTLLGWEDYQRGKVAVVFSTLFVSPIRRKMGDWDTQAYRNFNEAHDQYLAQIWAYHKLADQHPDKFRILFKRNDLDEVVTDWDQPKPDHPVGLLVLMEGAEGIRQPKELEEFWDLGVRIIGPAWSGTRFCGGSNEPGPLTEDGRELLEAMADLGITLDLSHMDELAAYQALDEYPGSMIVSHGNSAALLKNYNGNRLLSDEMIKRTIQRNGIIGLVPVLPFLMTDWKPADGRTRFSLESVFIEQIDHICQLAGDAQHVGIGSDYDGGFGLEHAPEDVDSIADLQKLDGILTSRGYVLQDIEAIMGGNWLRHLQETLPA